MSYQVYQLPGGYTDETGGIHRLVELLPLTGGDEELVALYPTSPILVTRLLSRCIQRIGTLGAATEDIARDLLVADRQFLLLKLRAISFGDHIQASVVHSACGSKMNIDFAISDIPVTESIDKGPLYTVQLSSQADEAQSEVVFRLPNGSDQEVLVPLLAADEEHAAALLLERCIQQSALEHVRHFSAQACMEIEQAMSAAGPQIELTIEDACVECGESFTTTFDIERFLLHELRLNINLLYREVHYLAYHYHWSEHELMSMPRHKRRRYIEVLSNEIERLNDISQA